MAAMNTVVTSFERCKALNLKSLSHWLGPYLSYDIKALSQWKGSLTEVMMAKVALTMKRRGVLEEREQKRGDAYVAFRRAFTACRHRRLDGTPLA